MLSLKPTLKQRPKRKVSLQVSDIKLDKRQKQKLLEEMNEEEKCLWELHILYPEKVKSFFKKELNERIKHLYPDEVQLSPEELQRISVQRLSKSSKSPHVLDQNLVRLMKLHHKKHAESLKQYLEWKRTQSTKRHRPPKSPERDSELAIEREADMALQNTAIQKKSIALGVQDAVSPSLCLTRAARQGRSGTGPEKIRQIQGGSEE